MSSISIARKHSPAPSITFECKKLLEACCSLLLKCHCRLCTGMIYLTPNTFNACWRLTFGLFGHFLRQSERRKMYLNLMSRFSFFFSSSPFACHASDNSHALNRRCSNYMILEVCKTSYIVYHLLDWSVPAMLATETLTSQPQNNALPRRASTRLLSFTAPRSWSLGLSEYTWVCRYQQYNW